MGCQIDRRAVNAYAIAFDVYGRDASFDPGRDPIVRVQMGRLRKALAAYAAGEGRDDPWRVVLEPRSYEPDWQPRHATAPRGRDPVRARAAPDPTARWARSMAAILVVALIAAAAAAANLRWHPRAPVAAEGRPILAVLPFAAEALSAEGAAAASGLQYEIGADLWRFEVARVLPIDDPSTLSRVSEDDARMSMGYFGPGPSRTGLVHGPTGLVVDYVLDGGIRQGGDRVRFDARLERAADRAVIWRSTGEATGDADSYASAVAAVARRLANEVGRPMGPLGRDALARVEARAERRAVPGVYACQLLYAAWQQGGATADYARSYACLRDLHDRGVRTSSSVAELAWMTALSTDASRLLFREGDLDGRLAEALALALSAVQIDPGDDTAHEHLALIQWMAGDEAAALASFRRALRLNPGYPQHQANLGLFLCLADRCDEGAPLAFAALEHAPDPPAWYYTAPTIKALLDGRHFGALAGAGFLLRGSDDNDCTYYVAAAGLAGRPVRSRRCEAVVAANRAAGDPLGGSRFWIRGPALVALLEEGVARAGL